MRTANHLVNADCVALVHCLGKMCAMQCTLCGMIGHLPAYCWFNAQLWSIARAEGHSLVQFKYRSNLRFIKKQAMLKAKQQVQLGNIKFTADAAMKLAKLANEYRSASEIVVGPNVDAAIGEINIR